MSTFSGDGHLTKDSPSVNQVGLRSLLSDGTAEEAAAEEEVGERMYYRLDEGYAELWRRMASVAMGGKVIFMPPCLFCMENH